MRQFSPAATSQTFFMTSLTFSKWLCPVMMRGTLTAASTSLTTSAASSALLLPFSGWVPSRRTLMSSAPNSSTQRLAISPGLSRTSWKNSRRESGYLAGGFVKDLHGHKGAMGMDGLRRRWKGRPVLPPMVTVWERRAALLGRRADGHFDNPPGACLFGYFKGHGLLSSSDSSLVIIRPTAW